MAAQFCPEPQGRRGPSTRMARGSGKGGSTHDPEGAADGLAGPGPGRPSSQVVPVSGEMLTNARLP